MSHLKFFKRNFLHYSLIGLLLISNQLLATEVMEPSTSGYMKKTLKATLHTDKLVEPIENFQSIEISLENSNIEGNLHLLKNISFSLDLGGQERTMDNLEQLKPLASMLSSLNLYEAGIDNSCMEVISYLTGLRQLDLSRNYFNDDGMQHLTPLNKLEKLAIVYNKVTARGIRSLVSLPRLEELDAGCTYLDNEGIQVISQSKNIRILNVRACNFDDKALSYLNSMENLQKVIISSNKINSLALQKFIQDNKHRQFEVIAEDLL